MGPVPSLAVRGRSRPAVALVAVALGLAVAGCSSSAAPSAGSGRGPAGRGGAGHLASATAPPRFGGASTTPSTAARRRIAVADAVSLLALVPLPPGAERHAASSVAATSQPPDTLGSPDLVDRAAWWTAPGSMSDVVAWIERHPPPGGGMAGQGSASTRGVTAWQAAGWAFPAPGPILTRRVLSVLVAPDGSRGVALRADAQVVFVPARSPASQLDPRSVATVTVTRSATPARPIAPALGPATGSTSDAAAVARVVRILDGLPVDNQGVHSCPAMLGPTYTMHLAGPTGTTLATVATDAGECGGLALTVRGRPQPAVDDPGGVLLHAMVLVLS